MIANRKMKKNHPFTLPIYTALVLFFASLIGLNFEEGGFSLSFIVDLSWGTWGLFVLAGVFTIFENTTKFLAFRYHEAAPLQKLAFLPNVWSFMIDFIAFQKHYSIWQVIGFALLFSFYTYELTDELCLKRGIDDEDERDVYKSAASSDHNKGGLKETELQDLERSAK